MENLSKIKRDDLIHRIEILKVKYSTDEETRFLLNDIITELTGKKYGLVWERHEESVDIQEKKSIPVFAEDKERNIISDPSFPYNFLLEGDNLHSLKLLEKTHKGLIDIIYIDPPYNTLKSGFTYDDEMVDNNDAYRHSKWLSFMEARLVIAKKLLSQKGVIFISIDNSELYNLKLLCDEIFNEENFVGNIIWRTTTDNNVSQITTEHEYVLCYALHKDKLDKWISKSPIVDKIQEKYLELKEAYSDCETIQKKLRKWIKENNTDLAGFTHYDNVDEKGVFHDGDIANTVQGGYRYDVIHPVTGKPCKIPEKGFRFTESTMQQMLLDGDIMFGEDETTLIKPKVRLLDNKATLKAYYYEDNRAATKTLEKIFDEKSRFSNPKSINLLKQLISYAAGKDALILDFFAGSGTTGQAVMELNQEDGGNRRFILCTNNEISGLNAIKYIHKKGYMLDYKPGERVKNQVIFSKIKKEIPIDSDLYKTLFVNNIKEYEGYGICQYITYIRLKTIITGHREDGSKYSDGIPVNLKYYKTDFVDKYSPDPDYFIEDELMKHIVEMIQLENGISIDNDKYIVLLTDEDAEAFENNIDSYHPVKVYVDGTVFLSKKIMNKLDTEGVEVLPIPDYYFAKDIKGVTK